MHHLESHVNLDSNAIRRIYCLDIVIIEKKPIQTCRRVKRPTKKPLASYMAALFETIFFYAVCFCHVVTAAPNATNFESSALSWDPRLNPSVGNGIYPRRFTATRCMSPVFSMDVVQKHRVTEREFPRPRQLLYEPI